MGLGKEISQLMDGHFLIIDTHTCIIMIMKQNIHKFKLLNLRSFFSLTTPLNCPSIKQWKYTRKVAYGPYLINLKFCCCQLHINLINSNIPDASQWDSQLIFRMRNSNQSENRRATANTKTLLNTVIAFNCKQKEQTNYEGIYTPLPTFLA